MFMRKTFWGKHNTPFPNPKQTQKTGRRKKSTSSTVLREDVRLWFCQFTKSNQTMHQVAFTVITGEPLIFSCQLWLPAQSFLIILWASLDFS